MPYTLPNTLSPGNPENVTDLNENLEALLTAVNELAAAASQELPTGVVLYTADDSAPTGFLLCDGTAVSRTDYAALFAAIGSTYGAGDGATTFNLPNLKGRVAVGRDAAQTEFDSLGETGGAKTHTLTEAELPAHDHPVTDPGHSHDAKGIGISFAAGGEEFIRPGGPDTNVAGDPIVSSLSNITVGNAGADTAHNNLQPYLVLNGIIRT